MAYEAANKNEIAKVNAQYHDGYTAKTLKDELDLAANVLMQEYIKDEYGRARDFNPLNIQVTTPNIGNLYGEDTTVRTGSNEDLLIGGDGRFNYLSGGDGNDLLIGGNQNDYLEGGAGDDTMVGGAGIDTYVINGHGRIIDTGQNNIVWNGKLIAGVFKEVEGNPGTYTFISDDQEYCLAFHSPGQLTLSDSDSVTFVNQTSAAAFENNDFSISLTEDTPSDFTYYLSGTPYRNEMVVDTFAAREDWALLCTAFPPGVESNEPFFDHPLGTTGPRMKITGGVSGDMLFGFVRHDEISGGDGGDIIMGNLEITNGKLLNLSGPLEGDLIDGGSGGDMLTGSGGDDLIFGGNGNDFLGGLNGEDILLGEAGNDVLAGASHADSLSGGDGDDLLFGDGYIGSQGEEPFSPWTILPPWVCSMLPRHPAIIPAM